MTMRHQLTYQQAVVCITTVTASWLLSIHTVCPLASNTHTRDLIKTHASRVIGPTSSFLHVNRRDARLVDQSTSHPSDCQLKLSDFQSKKKNIKNKINFLLIKNNIRFKSIQRFLSIRFYSNLENGNSQTESNANFTLNVSYFNTVGHHQCVCHFHFVDEKKQRTKSARTKSRETKRVTSISRFNYERD